MGMKSFRDLVAWQESYKLTLEIYKLTKSFPKDEEYGLTSQMRRCAVSVPSNLAEGFHRQNYREKLQFYHIASGSIAELHTQLLVSSSVGYCDEDNFDKVLLQLEAAHKLINGLIKKTKSHLP